MNDFDPLRSNAPLIAYTDCKSPYAFAAWGPTWQLHDQFGIAVDWRPFTLDIPSYLGAPAAESASATEAPGRTPGQWNAVRYAYHDARRYVALQGKVLRGTTKIWDSSLAGIALLWAGDQGTELLRRFGDLLFERFWRREIDVENPEELASLLDRCGVSTHGFAEFLAEEGRARHDEIQQRAFDAGIFGVPTYVCDGEVWFGREHLPRIRWLLGGRRGPAPDIAYRHFAAGSDPDGGTHRAATQGAAGAKSVDAWIDFANPHCYLACGPTLQLARELRIEIHWHAVAGHPFRILPAAVPDAPRGERHRAFRSAYRARELRMLAEARGLALELPSTPPDGSLAAMAFRWAMAHDPAAADALVPLLCQGCWSGTLDMTSATALRELLHATGVSTGGIEDWLAGAGRDELAAEQRAFASLGISELPLFVLDGEPFAGRQHLPMIRWLLTGRAGPPPI